MAFWSRSSPSQTPPSGTPPTPGHKDLSTFPTLSSSERDWRWNRVRAMMAKHNVDVLFALPDPANMLDSYFTNDSPGALVIFPLEGEPTAIFACS